MNDTRQFDVAIIGGGPAGLTAAIFLARYLHSVVVIDSGDPRNWEARGVHGYLGLEGIAPPELRGRGRDEARQFGAVFIDGSVASVERLGPERFRLTLERGGPIESSRILLAIGIKDVWPEVPGLERCYGETVHHCPDCDGYEARGCKTVVIARGRKAAGMALNVSTWTRDIIICTNGADPDLTATQLAQLDALEIPVVVERIVRLVSQQNAVRALELESGMLLDCERIFFAVGQYPADDLGVQLGCKRDEEGLIEVDHAYHTSVANVWAAGDIVPGPHLAITAASDGAIAALAIHRSLVPESQQLA